MRYVINITKNKTSKDGSILGKVLDFKNEMTLHEQSELNVYKKHPQLTACNREVTIYNRYTQQKVQTIMFGSNSYLGATIFPEAIQKAIEVTKELGIGSVEAPRILPFSFRGYCQKRSFPILGSFHFLSNLQG